MAGDVREVDELGRIVIPKKLRDLLDIKHGDPLEFFEDEGRIILRKYRSVRTCVFCHSTESNFIFKENLICINCWSEAVHLSDL